jgi:acyl CoA:acetate/3-ketoacid CoA transferase
LTKQWNRFDRQQIPFFPTNTSNRCSKNFFHNDSRFSSQDNERLNLGCVKTHSLRYDIPRNLRQKVISASDAAALVRDNDTICVSGFLCQGTMTQTETCHIVRECSNIYYLSFEHVGAPEAVLKALGERYVATSSPNRLALLFGGGVGDGSHRGLNHLAKTKEAENVPPMLRRTIGSLYGLLPKIGELALSGVVEAWVRTTAF